MTTPPVELRVSTDALKRILEENPEVRLKLDALAFEKIGEEIVRKANQRTMDEAKHIDAIVSRAFRNAEEAWAQSLRSGYNVPQELKDSISLHVRNALDQHYQVRQAQYDKMVGDMIADKIQRTVAVLQKHVNEQSAQFQKDCREYIRDQAREEFLAIIDGVKAKVGT